MPMVMNYLFPRAGKVFMRLNGNAAYRIDSLTCIQVMEIPGCTWLPRYDGTNLKIYINGVLDNTKAATAYHCPQYHEPWDWCRAVR